MAEPDQGHSDADNPQPLHQPFAAPAFLLKAEDKEDAGDGQ